MDAQSQKLLVTLIRTQRTAALGTLHDGAPLVSMVLYAPTADCSAFYLHISRLAQHTQAILRDSQVGLLIAEPDTGAQDPQTLARVSLQGTASEVLRTDADDEAIRALYLQRFPTATMTLSLGDFAFFRVIPRRGRFVAGFGQIFNLTGATLQAAALAHPSTQPIED